MQMSSHSPLTFSKPRSRNCRKHRPYLICPNTNSTVSNAERSAGGPAWSATSDASGPCRQMIGYAPPGCGWRHPAVAGPLRRDERVNAKILQAVNRLRRVVAGVGGHFPTWSFLSGGTCSPTPWPLRRPSTGWSTTRSSWNSKAPAIEPE